MRNRWFPLRIADYVPATQLKHLKAEGVTMARDPDFGVRVALEEVEEDASDFLSQSRNYVRPIELEFLSVRTLCYVFRDSRQYADGSSPQGLWSS